MWIKKDNSLYKSFKFNNFKNAFLFMTKVASLAEDRQHHPKWTNEWDRVEIWLTTHDKGSKVTAKDNEMADAIDQIYDQLNSKGTPKNTSSIKIYTDGGSRGNPGPAASGYILLDIEDKIIEKKGIFLGVTTNNQAEYKALQFAVEAAKSLEARTLDIYMDSLLIVNQMKGQFKVKNPDLLPIYNAIKNLLAGFEEVSFTHVPRALNKLADAMVNEALDQAVADA